MDSCIREVLGYINIHHVHLYGTSLGGFLAQIFAQHRPRRVKSLVVSNTFLDTQKFSAAMPWSPIVSWAPSFLLKRYILTGIRDGLHEPFIADSMDFVVGQVETLSREDLSSRLTINVVAASIGPLMLSDSLITIMDTNDYCAIPQHLKDQVTERYPSARRAILKSGGDFPSLSRPDEVNLYLQLHLTRVGVEPKLDLLPGISGDGNAGGSNDEKRGGEHSDDPPQDHGSPGAHEGGQQTEPSSGSETHNLDEQVSTSAETIRMALDVVPFMARTSSMLSVIVSYRSKVHYFKTFVESLRGSLV
ncbi:maspardin isoform X1 [Iris pallida]|uniref:Maspardin n=1 Tax=Iris pallida TaxID=29817 RepID=A0AAX6EK84_IRIPA|nr:maspardin isoform X1 [Iris pallida]